MPRALWGVLWTLAVAVVLSGCFRSDQDRALTTEIGKSGLDLVSYTGTTRGAYIWPADGDRHVCAEPPPDLGLTTAREISANLKAAAQTLGNIAAPSIDAGGAAKLSSAAIELAGRSQIVLLTREFLYRQCELAANFGPGSKQYDSLSKQYGDILNVVILLAKAEQQQAEAELQAVQVEARRLGILQTDRVNTIVAAVDNPDGSIDAGALKKILDAAKIDPSFKASIASRATAAELREYLEVVPDPVTEALVQAIPGG
jgi:hypothetical protein